MTQAEVFQILLQQAQAFLIPRQYRAVEDIDGGDFVTLFSYTNTEFRMRRATGSSVGLANGYIRNPVLAGDFAWFSPLGGLNDRLSGLVFGQTYYLDPTLPGKVTITSPVGTDIIQILGRVVNSTTLDTTINYLINGTGGSAVPSGPAGGDLSGTYPNPSVVWANGYPIYDLRYLKLSGGTMTGNLILNGDPTTNLQAATKQYIDNLINGIDWKEAAHVGTVTALPAYGVTGSGQILTGSVNGAIPSATTDNHTVLINERVLVKDEVGGNLPNNGIYNLTQVGDAFTPYILTRTSDANTPSLLLEATISIIYGSTLANSIWHLTPASVPIIIGTTNLSWVEIGGSGITSLNALTAVTQTLATGTTGTDFNISSATSTHTFNLPTASVANRGALSSADWTTFNNKVATTRTISTTAPLTGGGDLTANRTIAIPVATNAVDGYLSSANWTTFNNKIAGKVYRTTSDATPITASTANTLVYSRLITGGTFAVGDIVSIIYRARKVGVAGITSLRIYVNSSAAIAGGTLIATNSTAAGTLVAQMTREITIKTATNTEMYPAATSAASDMLNGVVAVSALNIDWTTDKYFVFAIQNANIGDTTTASMYDIRLIE